MLTIIVTLLLAILAFSGSLSLSEAITAYVVFVFAALAYYLASGASEREHNAYTEFAASSRSKSSGLTSSDAAAFNEDVNQLINNYPQPAVLVSLDGRVSAANAEAKEVFRLPRSGGLGPAIIRRADILKRLDEIALGKTPQPLDIEIAGTPDRFFQVWTAPVSILGKQRVLLVLIELTELRRAEKARADFLANASHELRTPLTSLAGFIETMRGPAKDDPEAWDRFLEIMYGQTERMRRLIHDLLSLSRIELSEYHKPQQIIEFSSLTEETFEAMLPIARDRGVTLDFISSTGQIKVHGVRDELAQVMQNLIENAIKYTRDETSILIELASGLTPDEARAFAARRWDNASRISILQSRVDDDVPLVAVRVSDEGNGISREHLPRLGERFYRVDEGRDRSIGGTGLGLAIVKHIVARHRGGLMVESEEGRGSAFGFWLPLATDAPAELTEVAGDETGPDPDSALQADDLAPVLKGKAD